jgi:sulfur relay (sulfurtransferase) complex TusBCD TusD component (DsrE family)
MEKLLTLSTLLLALLGSAAWAGANDPLFINMTSDEGHRISMALSFGAKQQALGHPLTLFLNDKGVLVGSKAHAKQYPEQQRMIAEILAKGGTVIICPMCMKHYGVQEADLLPGLKVGNPELTGAALFKDNGKTLTW